MDPTMENVVAARQAADKSEDECDKMARCVAQMQYKRDHYKNEMKISRYYVESEAEAKGNFIKYNGLLSEAHAKWSEALNTQAELWQTYCDLFDEYQKKEKEKEQQQVQEERPDEKCTFCGEMYSECGGDHGDEMRQIIRENSPWTRR